MANWQQKVAKATIGIKGVDRNTATLTMKFDTLDDFFGDAPARQVQITRELIVSAPNPVNVRLVDGKNYTAGDWLCEVAYLNLQAAIVDKPGDPQITINGVVKTISELRPFIASANWGIDIGDDTLTIGGDEFTIGSINALDWLNNEPATLQLVLRKA